MTLTSVALSILAVFLFLVVSNTALVEAGMLLPETKAEAKVESLKFSPRDRKSFKTVPFKPAPSDNQRRELEHAVASCIKTVEQQVPGAQFEASPDGGIVNTAGSDRPRFYFWSGVTHTDAFGDSVDLRLILECPRFSIRAPTPVQARR